MLWRKRRDPAKRSRLTLHIGIHRTGSTGLQRGMAANRARLATMGKCYPFEKHNHQEIAWGLRNGNVSGKALVKRLGPYQDTGHIILSGEDFCIHQDLGWLAPLKEIYDVDVVVYLRRQDHWLMSWYNQHIKWPFSRRHSVMTPQEFLRCLDEFHWLDFASMLGRWETALGHDKVVVRVVEKGRVEDTVNDFLALMGIDREALKFVRNHNDGLPVEVLEYARQAGMADIPKPQRKDVIRFLQEVAKSSGSSAKTLYTAIERQGVLDRFASANARVAQHWFGRDMLFNEAAPDDSGLYVEGSLVAQGKFDDELIRTSIAALSKQTR